MIHPALVRKSPISHIYVHLLKAADNFMKLTGLQWDHAMTYCMRIKGTQLYSVPARAVGNGTQEPTWFRSEAHFWKTHCILFGAEAEKQ